MNAPTLEQAEALRFFAAKAGRAWKAKLLDCWTTVVYPAWCEDYDAALQQVRNTLGPTWLLKHGQAVVGKGRRVKTLEAYGVKGMKSASWRRTFYDGDDLAAWCEKHGAQVLGTRQRDPQEIAAEGR